MKEDQKTHKTRIGSMEIEVIYVGELIKISVDNANINYGLSQDVIKQNEDRQINKGYLELNKLYFLFLIFISSLYIFSLYFNNLIIFRNLSFLLAILLGATISKLLNIKSWPGLAVLIISFLAINFYLQGDISINQIIGLFNRWLEK